MTRRNPINLFSPNELFGFQIAYFEGGVFSPRYDVTRNGKQLLFCVAEKAADSDSEEVEDQRSIKIVLNWFEELKKEVPVD